jgi:hypothetical protein
VDTAELRGLAAQYDDSDEFGYARQFGAALRQAADALDIVWGRLRAENTDEALAKIALIYKERDEARTECERLRVLAAEGLAAEEKMELRLIRLGAHLARAIEALKEIDGQQACARDKA